MENNLRVELAAVLSELWFDDAWALDKGGTYPYITQDNGDVSYTDEAQECFNSLYDQVGDVLDRYIKVKG
jgi:hypothetical protein